jgi:hypothetical protein
MASRPSGVPIPARSFSSASLRSLLAGVDQAFLIAAT